MKISPNMFAPSIGAQNFSYAPGMQPAPPVNPLFAQQQGNPRREMFSDILMAIGTGLASGNMGNSAQMLAQFSKDRDERKRASMGQNATMEWLKARKADDIIPLVQSGQITPMQAIQMATSSPDLPTNVREYEFARQQGFDGSFMDFQRAKGSQADETLGLNPIYGRNEKGDLVLFQPGNRGTVKQMQFPDGIQPLGPQEKAQETAFGREIGGSQGEALFSLPVQSAEARSAVEAAQSIIDDPALYRSVGPIDGRLPSFTADAIRFDEKVENLKAKTFIHARQALKGGGQITDFEGQRAENALLRASQAKSEADFIQAMQEFQAHVIRGFQLLEQQAGVQQGNKSTARQRYRYNPQTGSVE